MPFIIWTKEVPIIMLTAKGEVTKLVGPHDAPEGRLARATFARRTDAEAAITAYDGRPLDGPLSLGCAWMLLRGFPGLWRPLAAVEDLARTALSLFVFCARAVSCCTVCPEEGPGGAGRA